MGMIDRSTRRIRTSGRLANAGVTYELALYSYVYDMWKPGGSPQISAKLLSEFLGRTRNKN